jgi:hypothetical protein
VPHAPFVSPDDDTSDFLLLSFPASEALSEAVEEPLEDEDDKDAEAPDALDDDA